MVVCLCATSNVVFAKSKSLAQSMAVKKSAANKKAAAVRAQTKLKIAKLNQSAKQKITVITKKFKNIIQF